MSASVLYMSMSLDGYIAGPDDGPGNPGGDGFMRLHEWLATALAITHFRHSPTTNPQLTAPAPRSTPESGRSQGLLHPAAAGDFQLVLRQGIRGQALAAELGVSEKEANDVTYENQVLVLVGFGAYVLARDDRPYCEGLARILDETAWDGETFTRVLRRRILRHLDDCRICDNCGTCNVQTRIRE